MKEILFSIIIPVAKETYLEKAIKSVAVQREGNLELIIINDINSKIVTDIVNEIKEKYPYLNIKYFVNKENKGFEYPTNTWNQGLSYAKGKYAILLGDDDELGPGYFNEIKKIIKKFPESTIIRSKLLEIDNYGNVLKIGWNNILIENWIENIYYRNKYSRPQSTSEFVVKTDALNEIGGYVKFYKAWGSDEATWILLSKKIGYIVSTDKVYACWRRHSSSISKSKITNKMLEALLDLMKWEKSLLLDIDGNMNESLLRSMTIKSIEDRLENINKRLKDNSMRFKYLFKLIKKNIIKK